MNEQYSNSFSKQFREDQEEFLNIAIKKWKFHKNFKRNLIMFSLLGSKVIHMLGVFFLVFAIIFLVYNLQIVEVQVQYQDLCQAQGPKCTLKFNVPTEMTPPIFVYYILENFYTSNRKFFMSLDTGQLKGNVKTPDQLQDCSPYITNKDMGKVLAIDGKTELDPQDAAFPCGQIAYMFFNDSYSIKGIPIDEGDLAWDADRSENFINPPRYETFAWQNITNEHFMVWMRSAGLGKFKKLWGRVHKTIPVGQYTLSIENHYNVSSFNGRKSFYMTTSTPFGQKNLVLVGSYFAGAIICLISIVVMLVIYFRDKKKKLV